MTQSPEALTMRTRKEEYIDAHANRFALSFKTALSEESLASSYHSEYTFEHEPAFSRQLAFLLQLAKFSLQALTAQ